VTASGDPVIVRGTSIEQTRILDGPLIEQDTPLCSSGPRQSLAPSRWISRQSAGGRSCRIVGRVDNSIKVSSI
jgi:hypothetical protein